ncbi:MAG: sigma-70 family RNA polymerase sigma factor [Lentisphaeraceae bacterium]|nr:sigma-70 family RNA polymerase sigma factor [Lentisphaeraceae bacterium]
MADDWNTRLTLLQRAKNPDDQQAWDEFVKYYHDFIKVVLAQMNLNQKDSDDLIQEILLKIWKSLPKMDYDQSRARFRTWLSHLIRNRVIDHFRKVKRLSDKQEMIVEESGNLTPVKSEPEVEQIIQSEWEVYIVKLALERIAGHFSERAIDAFEMSLDNLPPDEIGEKLGIKGNSVTKLKNRVKQRLIKEIELLRSELEPAT